MIWKTVWWFIITLNTLSSYNPAVTLPGIFPNELKAYVHSTLSPGMLIPAYSRLIKLGEQKFPSHVE